MWYIIIGGTEFPITPACCPQVPVNSKSSGNEKMRFNSGMVNRPPAQPIQPQQHDERNRQPPDNHRVILSKAVYGQFRRSIQFEDVVRIDEGKQVDQKAGGSRDSQQ